MAIRALPGLPAPADVTPRTIVGHDVIDRNLALAYRHNMATGLIHTNSPGPDDGATRAFTQQIPQIVEAQLDPARRVAALTAAVASPRWRRRNVDRPPAKPARVT